MRESLKAFIQDESGQGMTEYALIILMIAIAVMAILPKITDNLKEIFEDAVDIFNEVAPK